VLTSKNDSGARFPLPFPCSPILSVCTRGFLRECTIWIHIWLWLWLPSSFSFLSLLSFLSHFPSLSASLPVFSPSPFPCLYPKPLNPAWGFEKRSFVLTTSYFSVLTRSKTGLVGVSLMSCWCCLVFTLYTACFPSAQHCEGKMYSCAVTVYNNVILEMQQLLVIWIFNWWIVAAN